MAGVDRRGTGDGHARLSEPSLVSPEDAGRGVANIKNYPFTDPFTAPFTRRWFRQELRGRGNGRSSGNWTRLHPLEPEVPLAQSVEHLQLFQPRQVAQAATFRFLGFDDVLKIGIHGWRKRFSNFAHAASSEWRARISRRRSVSAILASTNMTNRA